MRAIAVGLPIAVDLAHIGDMDEALAAQSSRRHTGDAGCGLAAADVRRTVQIASAHRDRVKPFAVVKVQMPQCCLAQPHRLFQHRVEHRREVAG